MTYLTIIFNIILSTLLAYMLYMFSNSIFISFLLTFFVIEYIKNDVDPIVQLNDLYVKNLNV